jgi:hypothetical protein
MAHLVRTEPWGTIDLDTTHRRIFIREDWQYRWVTAQGQPAWTPEEQIAFHRAVDRAVWVHWSNRARILARSVGVTRHPATDDRKWEINGVALVISFDVRMVRGGGHWRVTATKVDPATRPKPRAEVKNEKNEIELYTTDLLVKKAIRFEGDSWHVGFSVQAHEFGHTVLGLESDDYKPASNPNFDDRESIMNVGEQLRARHLRTVCEALASMVPGCRFTALVP